MKQKTTRNLFLTFSLLFVAGLSFGQIVTNGDDAGPGSLRDAVAQANANAGADVITFNGNFTVNLTSGEILVTDDVTITGNGTGNTIIDGSSNSGRIFNFQMDGGIIAGASSTLDAITIQNGSITGTADGGGAIFVSANDIVAPSSLTIVNCDFNNNSTESDTSGDGGGGAIYASDVSLDITGTEFNNNIATAASGSGGAIYYESQSVLTTFSLVNSDLTGNIAGRAGGAIETNTPNVLTITNVTFDGNQATGTPGNGGALHNTGISDTNVTGSTFINNIAGSEGGALWNQAGGTMTVNASTVTGNEAQGNDSSNGGGGLFNNGGTLIVSGATLVNNNSATGTSGSGGGILSTDGDVTVTDPNTTVNSNIANRAGGGIEIIDGSLTLQDVSLNSNNAGVAPNASASPGNGGGLHVSGIATIIINGGNIQGNIAANEGGGLWNQLGSTMTVGNTPTPNFSDNIASGDAPTTGGGAIFNNGGDLIVLAGNNIVNNLADGVSGSGGAILSNGGTVTITETTFTNNVSTRAGGAIEHTGGTLNLTGVNFDSNNVGVTSPLNSNPGNGGALHVGGDATTNITGGSVINNQAANEGGGLWNGSGIMTIIDVVIDGNSAHSAAAATSGGGGIYNEGGTVTTDATTQIINNIATVGPSGSGGGILNAGGTFTATGTTITNNTANRAGGGIEANNTDSGSVPGIVNLTNVTLDNNNAGGVAPAPGNGGGLHVSGSSAINITGGTVSGNTASKEGGGLWNNQGVMTITGTTIDGNDAQGDLVADPLEIVGGGGIFAEDGAGSVVIGAGTIISNNFASGTQGSGGGILMATGTTLSIDGSAGAVMITGNSASRAGGGLEDWSLDTNTNTLTNVVFMNNTAGLDAGAFTADGGPGNGGAIHVTGPGNNTITDGSASGNLAANEGGGFWNGSGVMTIVNTVIDANTASGSDAAVAGAAGGGGIFNEGGTVDISGTASVTNNIADGAQSTGGGILNAAGTLTANGTTITGNQSNRAGGGIETNGSGPVTLTDVTLDANQTGVVTGTGAPGNGGGIHVSGDSAVTITGGTSNGNTAANEGGALWNGSGVMTIVDTTIDANTASGNDAMSPGAAGGGGIYNEGGTVDISGTASVTNNIADGAQSTGGGILNASGILTANGTTITGNQSNRAGGGIETNGSSSVTLTDVALDGNMTGVVTGPGAPGNGGGLHVSGAAPVTITGGTVSGNTASKEGGGLWNNQGVMTITGTTIDGNDAQGDLVADPLEIVGGGGIFAEDGAGSVVIGAGTIISNNFASGTQGSGGGILMATGTTLSIDGSAGAVMITGNSASRAGGGLEDWSLDTNTNTLTNVVFMNNTAGLDAGAFTADGGPGNGGAIHVTGPGNNTITDGSASGNLAAAEGGAFWNGSGTMLVTGTSFDSNIASGADATNGGGALFNIGGTLTVSGASITNNVVDGTSGSGGGILNVNGGILSVTDTDILGNSASRAGGGIEDNSTVDLGDGALVGSVTLFGVQLNNNIAGSAPGNGGGLHLTGGADSNITSSVINGNTASNEGGGVWNGSGVMTISLTTIDGNTANGAAATNGGGGIFNNASGTINLNTSTVSNNVSTGAAAQGGGIHNKATTTLNITASTISGNTSASNGGGIYNNGTASILNATIANNTATANGGGVSGESSVTVKGSIIATNTAATGTDVDGTFVSNDYNLIGDDSGDAFPESANDIENVNPAIGPLADNGGTTLTHMLLSTSAAANAGDPGDTSLDQIGNAVFGDARDIGALEDQDALGVEDFGNSLSDTVLFPNPSTNGNVSLNIPTNITNTVTIRVLDMTGKQVHTQQATSGSVTLNLNRLAVGTYLVNISDGNTSSTLKLLMSR